MKKNDYGKCFFLLGIIRRRLFPARLISCFLFLWLLKVDAAVYAQPEVVVVKQTDLTFKQVFNTITKQLGYDIFYSDDDLDASQFVRLSAHNLSLEKILRELLKDSYFYEFVGKAILIRPLKKVQSQFKTTEIRGIVRDSKGNPLPGVTILIKGSNAGVSTDVNGRFYLDVANPENVVLVFSFVGMKSLEGVYRGEKELEIVMYEVVEEMQEVIVTGYQQIEKRQLTSAVSTVKAEDLNVIGASSIEDMLQGQLAGLSVVNTSAGPGAAPKIRVRGTATISGNADPLWVLDGVILENSVPVSVDELNNPDFMETFNSVIGGVSPNDIESITVLKDASATAIYGTRAANGVIVVTTRKGKRNSFNLSYQHTSAVRLKPAYADFDLLNSRERVELTQQMYDEGLTLWGSVGMEKLMGDYALGNLTREACEAEVRKLETRNTDWFDLLYRNAYTQTHNLSISGGTEKTDYYVSMNYIGEDGLDKISDYQSYGGMAKINTELFKGVRFGTTLQVGRRDRESNFTVNPFAYAASTNRTIPVYDEAGDYFYYRNGNYLFHVLNELNTTSYTTTQTDIKAMVELKVNLLKGLRYSGLYSYASSTSASIKYAREQSHYVAGIRGYDYGAGTEEQIAETKLPFGGTYDETDYEQRMSLIRNGLEYKAVLTDDLSLDMMAGQEFRFTNYRGVTSAGYGYMHDRGNIFYTPATGDNTGHLARNTMRRNIPKRSNVSYYGVVSAMYKDRYVINANIRFDGSNLFGSNPKYRYLPLWSVSGKWIVSNEAFLSGSQTVDNLAIRASWGLRGNIVEDSSPQIIATALPPNSLTQLFEMSILQAPNPELKWETTSSLNLGLEMELFRHRLNVVLDYYRDGSSDLITYKDVSSVTGFTNKYVNYADVKNHGLDLSVSGYIVRAKNLSWRSTLTLGFVKNKVTHSRVEPQAQKLVQSLYTAGQVVAGKPVNGMFSYRFAGLDADGMPLFYDKEGNKLGAADANIATDIYANVENLKYEGPRDPVLTGGFNNIIRYKDFSLSFHFAFGLKNKVRLPEFAYRTAPGASQNANRRIMDRWQKPGDEKTKIIPRLSGGRGSFSTGSGSFYTTDMFNQSQVTVVGGDFLRMRNIMLEYRLPARLLKKIVLGERTLGGVSLKFQVQNVFVVANKQLRGYDPETINYTNTAYGSLPLPRNFTLGLNVNF